MKIYIKKSTENCHFYSREKSLYVAWACFVNNTKITNNRTRKRQKHILQLILSKSCTIITASEQSVALPGGARRYSSVGSDVALESRGTSIDPRVRHIFS